MLQKDQICSILFKVCILSIVCVFMLCDDRKGFFIMQDMQTKQNEEVSVDLWRLAKILLHHAWIIGIVAVIAGVLSYATSAMFITPTYRAYFTAYVNNRNQAEGVGSTSTGDLNASIGLAQLYSEIITSRSVLTESADMCGIQMPFGKISKMVTTETSKTSALITVFVEAEDPVQATELAAAIAEVAPGHVAEVVDGSNMKIVDPPIQPENKYSPSNGRNAILGALIGMLLTIVVVVVMELVNDKVQNGTDLESRYQLAVIGNIPDLEDAMKNRDKYAYAKGGRG